jgi:hypothetical protein
MRPNRFAIAGSIALAANRCPKKGGHPSLLNPAIRARLVETSDLTRAPATAGGSVAASIRRLV